MLYIMRHGKTDWNASHRLQGRTDIPLNDEGRAMAKAAAKECAEVNFDVCYCSPLSRAKETADIILENRKVPIIIDERLIEMSFGEFEGMEYGFKEVDTPINIMFQHPEEYRESIGNAETFQELFDRTGEFLKQVVKADLEAGKDVLIVGHGAMNSGIICQLMDKPIEEFWSAGIENCKLFELGDTITDYELKFS